MDFARTLFQIGLAVFVGGCLPLLVRALQGLRAGRHGTPESLGWLAAVSGAVGMGLLASVPGGLAGAAGLVLVKLAMGLLAAFVRAVFRPGAAWATALLAALLAATAGSLALDLAALGPGGIPVGSPAQLWGQLATALPAAWLAAETALQLRAHGRRRALGLAGPAGSRRFLAACLASSTLVAICAVAAAEGLGLLGAPASLGLRGGLYAGLGALLLVVFAPSRALSAAPGGPGA